MEQIELGNPPLHMPRKIPDSVQESVSVKGPGTSSDERQKSNAFTEGGAPPHGLNILSIFMPTRQQHLRAQVHARPVFLVIVAKNGQAQGLPGQLGIGVPRVTSLEDLGA